MITVRLMSHLVQEDRLQVADTLVLLWDESADDLSKLEQDTMPEMKAMHRAGIDFLGVHVNDTFAGLWLMDDREGVTWIHTMILPEFKHLAMKMGTVALDWAFNQLELPVLMTEVPTLMKRAQRMAVYSGFELDGFARSTFVRDGVAYPIANYKLTKERYASYPNRHGGDRGHQRRNRYPI